MDTGSLTVFLIVQGVFGIKVRVDKTELLHWCEVGALWWNTSSFSEFITIFIWADKQNVINGTIVVVFCCLVVIYHQCESTFCKTISYISKYTHFKVETDIKNLFVVQWNMYVKYRDFAFQGFYPAKMKKWENGEYPQTGSNSKGEPIWKRSYNNAPVIYCGAKCFTIDYWFQTIAIVEVIIILFVLHLQIQVFIVFYVSHGFICRVKIRKDNKNLFRRKTLPSQATLVTCCV